MLTHSWNHSSHWKFLRKLDRARRLRVRRLAQREKFQTKVESLKKQIAEKNKQRHELARHLETELRSLNRWTHKLVGLRRRRNWRRYRRMRVKQQALRTKYTHGLAQLERVKHQLAKLHMERMRNKRLWRSIRIPRIPKKEEDKQQDTPSPSESLEKQPGKVTKRHFKRKPKRHAHSQTRKDLPEAKSKKAQSWHSKTSRHRRRHRAPSRTSQDQKQEAGHRGKARKRKKSTSSRKRGVPGDSAVTGDAHSAKGQRKKSMGNAVISPSYIRRRSTRRGTKSEIRKLRFAHHHNKKQEGMEHEPQDIDEKSEDLAYHIIAEPVTIVERNAKVTKYVEVDKVHGKKRRQAEKQLLKMNKFKNSILLDEEYPEMSLSGKAEQDDWARNKLAKLRLEAQSNNQRDSTSTLYSVPSNRGIYNEKYGAIQRALTQSAWHRKRKERAKETEAGAAVSGVSAPSRPLKTSPRMSVSHKRVVGSGQVKRPKPVGEESRAVQTMHFPVFKGVTLKVNEAAVEGAAKRKEDFKLLVSKRKLMLTTARDEAHGSRKQRSANAKQKRRMSEEIRAALKRYEEMRNFKTPQLDSDDNATSVAKLPLQAISVHGLLQDPRLLSQLGSNILLSKAFKQLKEKDLKRILTNFKKQAAAAQKASLSGKRKSVSGKKDAQVAETKRRSTYQYDSFEDWVPPDDYDYDVFAHLVSSKVQVQPDRSSVSSQQKADEHRPKRRSRPTAAEQGSSESAHVRMSMLMQLRRSRREYYDRMVNAKVKRSSSHPQYVARGRWEAKAMPKKSESEKAAACGMPNCRAATDTGADCCKFTPKLRGLASDNAADVDDDEHTECMKEPNLA